MAGVRTEGAKGWGNMAQSEGVPGKECQKGEKNKEDKKKKAYRKWDTDVDGEAMGAEALGEKKK
jgi:hypothetical protein